METNKGKQRHVVWFLTDEGVREQVIHRRMLAPNSEYSMSCLLVLPWHKRFNRTFLQICMPLKNEHVVNKLTVSLLLLLLLRFIVLCGETFGSLLKENIRGYRFASDADFYD